MKNHLFQMIILTGLMVLLSSCHPDAKPPLAKVVPSHFTFHQKTLSDPYKWMEITSDTAVLNYIRAENRYADAYFEKLKSLQTILYKEITARDPKQTGNKEITAESTSVTSPDGKNTLFVKNRDLFVHRIGSPSSEDRLIYSEPDPRFMIGITLSASGKFVFIKVCNNETTETWFLPSDLRTLRPVRIQLRESGHRYTVEHYSSDYFWILSNLNALNGKLVQAKIGYPGSDFWITAISYHDSTFLQGFAVINQKYLLLLEKRFPKTSCRIIDMTPKRGEERENRVTFTEPDGNLIYEGYDSIHGKILLRYSSVLSPVTLYTYDPVSRKLGIRWQTKIKQYIKDDYAAKLVWVPSQDRTAIPVTILYKQGLDKKDGTNPLLLTAYGCYGLENPAKFNSPYISLLDRGFYVAIAHIRGGGELGPVWWEEGRRLKKKNSFTDFLDCAEFLINHQYTSRGLITATGIGAGGLVMGVAANERPDLFKAVILEVPFVDPLSALLDSAKNQPEVNEWMEFGNPNEKPLFDYILSYSPYQNVRKQDYPAMFFRAGYLDKNVTCAETMKMAASLRKNKTGEHILLIRTEMDPDHQESTGPELRVQQLADQFAFILDLYGMKK